MTRQWIAICVGLALLAGCGVVTGLGAGQPAPAGSAPAATAIEFEQLAYPTDSPSTIPSEATVRYSDLPASNEGLLSLDIYPSGQPSSPVMIYVHGGGWQNGDKSFVFLKPAAFNDAGFVFVSINYRLYPEVTVPEQAADVARAVAWVKDHIAEYGGDPGQIWLMGHSAGAHLVALVGTDESLLRAAGADLTDLRGVIALDTPAYDLPALLKAAPRPLSLKYAKLFGGSMETLQALSPSRHVEAGKGIPPFLIVYSNMSLFNGSLSESFADLLRAAGVRVEVLPALDKNHAQVNREIGDPDSYVSRAVFSFVMP